MLLSINDLHFAYGVQPIFKDLNLHVDRKERVGLIGPNGCGKSTFFKLITGSCLPDSGTISKAKGITLGLLTQDFKHQETQRVRDIFDAIYAPLHLLYEQIQQLEDAIENSDEATQLKLVEEALALRERYEEKGGFEIESRIRATITGLGFQSQDLDQCFGAFSGGEKTRIALGALLLESPDLLLLDEPTNYLDFKALNWLENYLNNYQGSFIIISHDRFFLDKVCTRICEIENYAMISYSGNYSAYAEKKRQRDTALTAAWEKQQKELSRQKQIAQRLRDYDSLQSSRRAASREKAIAKTELLDLPTHGPSLHFSFTPKIISGNDVLMVENLSKGFPNQSSGKIHHIFENIHFEVHRGEKIGIIGPNGIGKTTLFKILNRELPADSGKVRYGVKVVPGYYAQESDETILDPNRTLIDAIRDIDTFLSDGEVRSILAPFGFRGETVFRQCRDLSGGETARLKVAQLMVSEANLLLMDEPTNHIDMATREILEDALSQYEGTLVFISHDRYFLNKIATHIFELTPTGMLTFEGNYNTYVAWQNKIAAENQSTPQPTPMTKTQRKQVFKEQKAAAAEIRKQKQQLKALEEALETNDAFIADLENQMCSPDFYEDPDQVQQMTAAYHQAKEKSKTLLAQWEDLAMRLDTM